MKDKLLQHKRRDVVANALNDFGSCSARQRGGWSPIQARKRKASLAGLRLLRRRKGRLLGFVILKPKVSSKDTPQLISDGRGRAAKVNCRECNRVVLDHQRVREITSQSLDVKTNLQPCPIEGHGPPAIEDRRTSGKDIRS